MLSGSLVETMREEETQGELKDRSPGHQAEGLEGGLGASNSIF